MWTSQEDLNFLHFGASKKNIYCSLSQVVSRPQIFTALPSRKNFLFSKSTNEQDLHVPVIPTIEWLVEAMQSVMHCKKYMLFCSDNGLFIFENTFSAEIVFDFFFKRGLQVHV